MTFAMSAVALTVLSMAFGFVVHELLLKSEYMQVATLFRTEADHGKYFVYMLLAHVFIGIGMTWVYRQGREAKRGLPRAFASGLQWPCSRRSRCTSSTSRCSRCPPESS